MLLYFPNPHRGGEPYVKSCRILGTSFSIDDDSEKYPMEINEHNQGILEMIHMILLTA